MSIRDADDEWSGEAFRHFTLQLAMRIYLPAGVAAGHARHVSGMRLGVAHLATGSERSSAKDPRDSRDRRQTNERDPGGHDRAPQSTLPLRILLSLDHGVLDRSIHGAERGVWRRFVVQARRRGDAG